jgi:hypothetical protein
MSTPTGPWNLPNAPNESTDQVFTAAEPGVVGCATQIFYCNPELPDDKKCINMYSGAADTKQLSDIWPNTQDRMALGGVVGAMMSLLSVTPEDFYATAGVASLLAGFTVLGPYQTAKLPPNQWQKESEYNFQAVLASIQASTVEVLRGRTPWLNQHTGNLCLHTDGCRKICGYQVSYLQVLQNLGRHGLPK